MFQHLGWDRAIWTGGASASSTFARQRTPFGKSPVSFHAEACNGDSKFRLSALKAAISSQQTKTNGRRSGGGTKLKSYRL